MKVSVQDFELHLIPFMKKIADTMPTSLHKWIGGAMVATGAKRIETLLAAHVGADGMLDLDSVKSLVDYGFQSSGGEVVIPFGAEGLSFLGVRPVNIKISKADADAFFAGFKA